MIIIDWDFDVPIDTLKLFILAVITGSKTISVFKLLNNRDRAVGSSSGS